MKFFFDNPTQIAFWDGIKVQFVSGIGIGDQIIRGDTGEVFSIEQYLYLMENNVDPYFMPPDGYDCIVVYDWWVNLDHYILDEREEEF